MKKKIDIQKIGFYHDTLVRWKNASVEAKLNWLDSALRFGKAKKTIIKKQ